MASFGDQLKAEVGSTGSAELKIHKHDAPATSIELLKRVRVALCGLDLVALGREQILEHLQECSFVIDGKDSPKLGGLF